MEIYSKTKKDYINYRKNNGEPNFGSGLFERRLVIQQDINFNFYSAYDYHKKYNIDESLLNNRQNDLFLFKIKNNEYVVKDNNDTISVEKKSSEAKEESKDINDIIKYYPYTNLIKDNGKRKLINNHGILSLENNKIKVDKHSNTENSSSGVSALSREDDISIPISSASANTRASYSSNEELNKMDINFNVINDIINDSNNVYTYASDNLFCIVIKKNTKEEGKGEVEGEGKGEVEGEGKGEGKGEEKSYIIITLSYGFPFVGWHPTSVEQIRSFYNITSTYEFNYENIQTLKTLFIGLDLDSNKIEEIWGFSHDKIERSYLKSINDIKKIVGVYDNIIVLKKDNRIENQNSTYYDSILNVNVKDILCTKIYGHLCVLYDNTECIIHYFINNKRLNKKINGVASIYATDTSIIALKDDNTIEYHTDPSFEKLYKNVKKIIDGNILKICTDKNAVAILLNNNNNIIILDENKYGYNKGITTYKYYKLTKNDDDTYTIIAYDVKYKIRDNIDGKTIIIITQFIYILLLFYLNFKK